MPGTLSAYQVRVQNVNNQFICGQTLQSDYAAL